jgi:hypothetical protein
MTDVQGNFDTSVAPPTDRSGLGSDRLRRLLNDASRGDDGPIKPDAVSEFLGTPSSHGLDAAGMSSDFALRTGTATAGSTSDVAPDHSISPPAPAGTIATDGNGTHADASAAPPSIGTLIESGTKSILLATDASPTTPGPWTSAAAPPMPVQRGRADHGGDVTPNFAPDVLAARDQLASAIATASPQAAAITTLPPVHTIGVPLPTLGGDVHAGHGQHG